MDILLVKFGNLFDLLDYLQFQRTLKKIFDLAMRPFALR